MGARVDALVCTGSPFAARSSSKLKSFRAINELGYVCWSAPRLLTTSSAEYGRLMPLYRGDAHQSFTACTCSSKSASSAWPALEASASSWKESPGRAVDKGGSTALSVELAMRYAVVESGRRSCGVRHAVRRERLWRATERGTVRSIAAVGCIVRLYPAGPVFSTSENYCDVVLVSNSREPLKPVVTRKTADGEVCHPRCLSSAVTSSSRTRTERRSAYKMAARVLHIVFCGNVSPPLRTSRG
jgi:hypothetical protein